PSVPATCGSEASRIWLARKLSAVGTALSARSCAKYASRWAMDHEFKSDSGEGGGSGAAWVWAQRSPIRIVVSMLEPIYRRIECQTLAGVPCRREIALVSARRAHEP